MKRKFAAITLEICLLTGVCLLTSCSTPNATETEMQFEPSYYPLLMQVTEVNNNIVTSVDSYGSLWVFKRENANVNELYSCVMYDNGTEEIEDDQIVKMRPSRNSDYIIVSETN